MKLYRICYIVLAMYMRCITVLYFTCSHVSICVINNSSCTSSSNTRSSNTSSSPSSNSSTSSSAHVCSRECPSPVQVAVMVSVTGAL